MVPAWFGVEGGNWQHVFLLLPPACALLALGMGRKAWQRYGMVLGILAGVAFGHAMEGWEGALVGGLAGWVVGFAAGRHMPWIARTLPDRWGVVLAWSFTAGAMGLIPLLLAIKLMWSRLDDDDFAFGAVAVFLGVFCAANRGWWEAGTVRWADFARRWKVYFGKWLDPRVLPWLLAFVFCGLTVGGMREQYDVVSGESLSVVLKPVSYAWPASLMAAALIGIAAARRRRSAANGAYLLGCLLAACVMGVSLVAMARHRLEADAAGLSVRMGLFGKADLAREELARVDIKVVKVRRGTRSWPVLVTAGGKRHSLRNLRMAYELRDWLGEEWGVPVEERR